MQKKRNKTNNFKILIAVFALIIVASIIGVTFAWFTDKKSYNGDLTFGTIELEITGKNVKNETKTLEFDVSRTNGTYTQGGKVMPGDVVEMKFNVGLSKTSEPAYYLVFLSDASGSFEDACYYSDGTTMHALDGTTKNVGAVSSSSSHSFTIPATISEDFTGKGSVANIKLNIYAIQQANLSEEEAYDKLFEKHYSNEGVQLKSSADFQTSLGGSSAVATYTKVGFYKTSDFDSTGYTLDNTLTTSMNSNLKALDANKDLIQVYKNSNDVAVVSENKILAPKNCENLFNNYAKATTIDVSNLDTSKTTSMKKMFNAVYGGAPKTALTSIVGLDKLDTSNVTTMYIMFQACTKLISVDGIENFNTSNVTDMKGMFNSCYALKTLDLSGWDTSKVTDMRQMFMNCKALTTLDISNFNTNNVTDMSYMFNQCLSLTTLDVSSFNTSNVTDMKRMFYSLGLKSSSSEVNIIGLSNFDTSKVTDMNAMFANGEDFTGSGKLTNNTLAGISNWNVGNVENMTTMFYGQGTNLTTLDLSKWKPSKCKSFNHMFADCFKLISMDMTNWDTQSVRTVFNMFNDCKALTSVGDISHWNTQSLYDVGQMFTRCTSLTGKMNLSGWNTSNVRDMVGTFEGCTGLTEIDLSGWNNVNVIAGITEAMTKTWPDYNSSSNIYYAWSSEADACENMFKDCSGLTKIYVGSNWDTSKYNNSTTFTGTCSISEVTVK